MLNKKKTAEELDENNQKRHQHILVKFLYCARAIDPTMLMALKSLSVVHTNTTIKTAKHITILLNYNVSHTDAVT